jgi:hypothetical protein
MTDIHSCSYYCDRPKCVKAQRDELRDKLAQPEQEPVKPSLWEQYHAAQPLQGAMPWEQLYPQFENFISPAAQPEQEPVEWMWYEAPVKTQWGHDMVVADFAIDKDSTVSVYCERDQTAKVEVMFTPPAAQRTWVGLTDAERNKLWRDVVKWGDPSHDDVDLMKALEAVMKEKNDR